MIALFFLGTSAVHVEEIEKNIQIDWNRDQYFITVGWTRDQYNSSPLLPPSFIPIAHKTKLSCFVEFILQTIGLSGEGSTNGPKRGLRAGIRVAAVQQVPCASMQCYYNYQATKFVLTVQHCVEVPWLSKKVDDEFWL